MSAFEECNFTPDWNEFFLSRLVTQIPQLLPCLSDQGSLSLLRIARLSEKQVLKHSDIYRLNTDNLTPKKEKNQLL